MKVLLSGLIFTALTVPLWAQETAKDYLQRGIADYQSKRYLEASRNFDKAVELDPKMPDAYYWRGTTEISDQKALSDLNRAIQLKPDYAAAFYIKALKEQIGGKDGAALLDYTTAIKLDPKMTEAYLGRASIYYTKGFAEKTLSDYSKIIELRPDGSSYYCRGLAYLDFGKPNQAVDDLTRSIKLDPTYYWAYMQRAKAYRKLGKTALAIADERKAAQIGTPKS
jgi:tetratricopeptide (TPR) repeat protein